jgi:energy-coupling factor transporter ATP-binding protein EcfA2
MQDFQQPRWVQEIEKYLFVKSQFAVWGNIRDVYALACGDTVTFQPLAETLVSILVRFQYESVLEYTPLSGFSVLHQAKAAGEVVPESGEQAFTLAAAADRLEKLSAPGRPLSAVLLNFSSRLPDVCERDVNEFYYRVFRLSQTGKPALPAKTDSSANRNNFARYHLIFWILDKENDLPPWYALDNPMVRLLSIPKPDHQSRARLVDFIAPTIAGYADLSPREQEGKKGLFLDQTGGLFCREINDIAKLAKMDGLSFAEISTAIRQYKLGISDNPWSKLVASPAIRNAEETIAGRVIGQPEAVLHAADIIKRAVFNLSGAQFSATSQRPKGVLFLAGPTGVGKTELAKTLSEMIFGSSTNCIRFDMSEFAQEHANQRLLGAPPGYVGYDGGGQLTNAVKQSPFSLILFDEIEKGHPKIWDIFLQILDDGRLTSGRGETVYFSEALLVFTSNLGASDVGACANYETMRNTFLASIEKFFRVTLQRPEILNRIGNNIIVFDFIRQENAHAIFDKMMRQTLGKVKEEHGITLSLEETVLQQLRSQCCADLSMGGRGIGNNIEQYFINPLARELFARKAEKGGVWNVAGMEMRDTVCSLTIAQQ